MDRRTLGATGLEVSRLGIGLAEIGFLLSHEEADAAGKVLNAALDSGINFLDTAGCYNISEELIGATVNARRDEYVLATKAGHMTGDCGEDGWSYECVTASIERSLARMRTDHIDLMQLHSCDVETLERGDAVNALLDARVRGLVDYIGYSGDNEGAIWAAESGYFEVIQTSFNLVDQGARGKLFDLVRERNLGLIAKRPIANGVWGRETDPNPYGGESYTAAYLDRQLAMRADGPLAEEPDDHILASLGFTLSHNEVTVAIVGSRNSDHVRANVGLLDKLPLAPGFIDAAHARFDQLGAEWRQLS